MPFFLVSRGPERDNREREMEDVKAKYNSVRTKKKKKQQQRSEDNGTAE